MLTKIIDRIKNEPVITNAILSILSLVVLSVVDVIAADGGELAAVVAAILAGAGITRQRVTPV